MKPSEEQPRSTIPPADVFDPKWDKQLTQEQWNVVKWLFEDHGATG